jgi:signal transduction histidine kinase
LDLLLLVVTSAIVFILSSLTNTFERFAEWSRQYEDWQVDELVTVAAVLLVALGIFSWRGWKNLGHEIRQRRRAEEELRQRHQELSTLYNVALASTRDPSINSILHNTLAELTRALNVPFGSIHLKRGQTFTLRSYRGFTVEEAKNLEALDPAHTPWLAEGKLIHEPLDQLPGQIAAWEKARGIQAWVSAPMRSKSEVIGVIRLARQDGAPFTPADRSLMTGVANQVAMILEKKGLEQQLQQAQKMESVGRLAGGVAHDFNNLLTAMMGYAGLARESIPPDNPASVCVQEIQKAADRAATLTNQLLAFARRQIIEPRVINLNDLILDMGKMLRRLIGEDVELVLRPASEACAVKVDRGQMEQVLVNLAVNARDAMPDGGRLTIETTIVTLDEGYALTHPEVSPGQYVMLAVSDNGVGMAEEVKAHLFEPFFTTKEKGKGTGLGLATCYGIVKQSSGHIWVYSEPGQGTTFKIYLPQVDELPGSLPESEEPAALLRGKETVLLVEDEPAVRELAAHVLRAQGYTVLEADNGDAALRQVGEQAGEKIHLLLTDVVMPRMSGKELADRLKVIRPDLKVLFTSGYTDDAIVHHGVLQAEIAFLQKPFSPVTLARKVREVLDK